MPYRYRLLWLFSLLCLALTTAPAVARDVKIIFMQYTPPYVFEDGRGIIVDLVRQALEPAGHRLVPVYAPITRGLDLFAEKHIDGIAVIQQSSGLAANYTAAYTSYHNYVFALKSRKFSVRTLDDLKDKVVIGFQNSHKYLGEAYGRAVAANPKYKELPDQETQTLMLLLGRIDLAVMDESIFRFYRNKLVAEGKAPATAEVQAFDLFPATPYGAAFGDPALRDEFDRGMAALRKNGGYDAIYRKYVGQHFPIKK